jgi:hypothetical protein
MHRSVCSGLYQAHAHCECCEAMHACIGVCVQACIRRMLTVNAARRCMHALECVFGLVQGAWSLWLLRGDACAIMPVCIGLHGCDLANVHMHM